MSANASSRDADARPLARFGRDTLLYAPARIAPALAGLILTVVFTRVLPASEYGLYTLALAVVAPVIVVLTEWTAQPLARFYSEYRERGQLDRYAVILRRLGLAVVAAAAVSAVLVYGIARPAWGASMAGAVALYLFSFALISVLNPIVAAGLDARFYSGVQVAIPIIHIGVAVGLLALSDPSPAHMMWGLAIANALALPVVAWRLRRHVPRAPEHARSVDLGRFIRYGTPMLLWFFASQLLNVGDLYFIQAFRGTAEVGVYSASYNLAAGIGGLLGAPIVLAAFPLIMRLAARDTNHARVRAVLREMTDWYALFALGLVGAMFAAGRDLAHLVLGDAFIAGWVVVVPVLVGHAIWHGAMLGQKGLEIAERTDLMLVWVLVAAAANAALNWWAVPRYGYVAAAYTTVASYLLYAILVWASTYRAVPWDVPWTKVGGSAVVAAGAALAAAHVPAAAGLEGALVRGSVYAVLFLIGATVLKRAAMRQFVENVRSRGEGAA